jgi:hypothetical protein
VLDPCKAVDDRHDANQAQGLKHSRIVGNDGIQELQCSRQEADLGLLEHFHECDHSRLAQKPPAESASRVHVYPRNKAKHRSALDRHPNNTTGCTCKEEPTKSHADAAMFICTSERTHAYMRKPECSLSLTLCLGTLWLETKTAARCARWVESRQGKRN